MPRVPPSCRNDRDFYSSALWRSRRCLLPPAPPKRTNASTSVSRSRPADVAFRRPRPRPGAPVDQPIPAVPEGGDPVRAPDDPGATGPRRPRLDRGPGRSTQRRAARDPRRPAQRAVLRPATSPTRCACPRRKALTTGLIRCSRQDAGPPSDPANLDSSRVTIRGSRPPFGRYGPAAATPRHPGHLAAPMTPRLHLHPGRYPRQRLGRRAEPTPIDLAPGFRRVMPAAARVRPADSSGRGTADRSPRQSATSPPTRGARRSA